MMKYTAGLNKASTAYKMVKADVSAAYKMVKCAVRLKTLLPTRW